MTETLHIDWTRCDGRGLCTELLTPLLGRDDWGYPLVRQAGGGGRGNVDIDDEYAGAAREAVQLCPKLALSISNQAPGVRDRRRPRTSR
ncbi:ferredoxin [Arthrobacter sp.]|uniref:ferredoxin n=1 Tax=Arthrobacter sp. TaxID=1667 RepID=UPI0026E053D7|nr:ferredoxin [Arthrobacter sp.]MDO5753119.1 ferredoxin [Arthrobacter sp.]